MNDATLRGLSSVPSTTGRWRAAGLAGLALAALSPAALAGGSVDYQVQRVEVTQAIQTGSTRLVGGRPTFVRATIKVDGGGTIQPVDGILRVLADGAEIADSPFFTTNGPLLVNGGIPNYNDIDGTLNFVFIPPVSSEVILTVTANPPGPNVQPETDPLNNSLTTPAFVFENQSVPEHVYVPVDYRPSGGDVPNPPDPDLIKPGVGDNFVQAIYPAPDWNYHRSPAPAKLWTSSLSGSGSSLNSSLATDANLMSPVPDFIYGWIPGSLPYNGQAQLPGKAAMGNTQNIRHQRTFAHELGHNFGMAHNSFKTGIIGIDVEHHLNITEGLPQVQGAQQNDIMVPGLLTPQAWVRPGTWDFVFDHSAFNDADAANASETGPNLLVSGVWNRQTGELDVQHLLTFEGGERTQPVPLDEADLIVRSYAGGNLLAEVPILARTSVDCGGADSWTQADPTVSFIAVLPGEVAGQSADRLAIVDPSQGPAAPLQLFRSASAPEVELTTPTFTVDPAGSLTLAWQASDADGDPLSYYVRYSPNGERMVPIATGATETLLEVSLAELPAFVPGQGFFEVLATDGLHTTAVRSAPLVPTAGQAGGGGGNAPFAHILSPDSGTTFQRGTTVILHASTWDIEDLVLDGADVVWTSDLDGVVGNGRVTMTSSLSVGTHVITLSTADQDGNPASEATTVTITARNLPPNLTLCGIHVGLGGTGAATFSLCQPPSAPTGSQGLDLRLLGAAPNQTAWILAGPGTEATPLLGGTLHPSPVTLVVPATTDEQGALAISGLPYEAVRGLTFQVVYADPAQPQGFGFSDAVLIP